MEEIIRLNLRLQSMNRKSIWGMIASMLLAVTGCQKEVGEQLQGKWQLKTVEQSGRVTSVDTVWYNFQSESLFMYQVYWAERDSFVHQYGYKTQPGADVIRIELTNYPRPKGDFLPFTDWENEVRVFSVEKISGKRLVLQCENRTYHFIRF
jgi:hypothetical protein